MARRASRRLWRCLRAVARMVVRMAEASAPRSERKPPMTLRWMTGRAEVALGAVVGGLDVVALQEHVEAVAVGAVALLKAGGLGLWRDVAVEDQPVGGVLDQQPAARERRGRDPLALVMQPDRAAEDVAQVQRPDPLGAGVGLAGERQVARLVAVADLVLGRR